MNLSDVKNIFGNLEALTGPDNIYARDEAGNIDQYSLRPLDEVYEDFEDVFGTLTEKEARNIYDLIQSRDEGELQNNLKKLLDDIDNIPVDSHELLREWKRIRHDSAVEMKEIQSNIFGLIDQKDEAIAAVDVAKKKYESMTPEWYGPKAIETAHSRVTDAVADFNDTVSELENKKQHLSFETYVNDYAKTKISQLKSIEREKTLAPLREKLRQSIEVAKDQAIALKAVAVRATESIGHAAAMAKNGIVIGDKINGMLFTPVLDRLELIHQAKAMKQIEGLAKTEKVMRGIEDDLLAKYEKKMDRQDKLNAAKEFLSKRTGKDYGQKEVKHAANFEELKKILGDNEIKSLGRFKARHLEKLDKELDKENVKLEKTMQKMQKDLERRAKAYEKIQNKIDIAHEKDGLSERSMIKFAEKLEKYTGIKVNDNFKKKLEGLSFDDPKAEMIRAKMFEIYNIDVKDMPGMDR